MRLGISLCLCYHTYCKYTGTCLVLCLQEVHIPRYTVYVWYYVRNAYIYIYIFVCVLILQSWSYGRAVVVARSAVARGVLLDVRQWLFYHAHACIIFM